MFRPKPNTQAYEMVEFASAPSAELAALLEEDEMSHQSSASGYAPSKQVRLADEAEQSLIDIEEGRGQTLPVQRLESTSPDDVNTQNIGELLVLLEDIKKAIILLKGEHKKQSAANNFIRKVWPYSFYSLPSVVVSTSLVLMLISTITVFLVSGLKASALSEKNKYYYQHDYDENDDDFRRYQSLNKIAAIAAASCGGVVAVTLIYAVVSLISHFSNDSNRYTSIPLHTVTDDVLIHLGIAATDESKTLDIIDELESHYAIQTDKLKKRIASLPLPDQLRRESSSYFYGVPRDITDTVRLFALNGTEHFALRHANVAIEEEPFKGVTRVLHPERNFFRML